MPLRAAAVVLSLAIIGLLSMLLVHIRKFDFEDFTNSVQALDASIGSVVFIWLSESMSVMWARWPLLLGVAFVIVVLFFRGGVVEAWARFWSWRSSKQKT